jgi:outer membrane autotransporter protein
MPCRSSSLRLLLAAGTALTGMPWASNAGAADFTIETPTTTGQTLAAGQTGTVTSTGAIAPAGGPAMTISGTATLENHGTITGGAGNGTGDSKDKGGSTPPGAGILLKQTGQGSVIHNTGVISGADGAAGIEVDYAPAGAATTSIVNTGTIKGGNAASSSGFGYAGINGTGPISLTNSGRIEAGLNGDGTRADAIETGHRALSTVSVVNEAAGLIVGRVELSGPTDFTNAGSIEGSISLAGDMSNRIALTGGTVDGSIGLSFLAAPASQTFLLSGGTITGDVVLAGPVPNAAHSVILSNGTIGSLLDVGTSTGTVAVDPDAGRTVNLDGGGEALRGAGLATITKTGAGRLEIGGANTTLTATWDLRDGTVAVRSSQALGGGTIAGNGGTLEASGGTIALSNPVGLGVGGLTVSGSEHLTLAGAITGTGGLTKTGTGVLMLAGTNGYTGVTTVSGGTVAIRDDSGLGHAAGALVLSGGTVQTVAELTTSRTTMLGDGGGTFLTDTGTTLTHTGAITGTGRLTKDGDGTLTLTGTNTHTGGTVVNAGTLRVNGSVASLVTIGADGTLGGSGSFGGGITNNGVVTPGNSIGTMNVAGPLAFGAGSVYQIEADAAGRSDRIDVTGPATLAGTLQVIPEAGTYGFQTDYTILTATDPLVGTFDNVRTASAFLDPSLTYGTHAVTLRLVRNDLALAATAATANQGAVAGALDAASAGATGDLSTVLAAIAVLPAEQARQAFDQLSGANLAANAVPQFLSRARFDATVQASALRQGGGVTTDPTGFAQAPAYQVLGLGRMAELGGTLAQLGPTLSVAPQDGQDGLGGWISGYGLGGEVDGDGNAAGFEYRTGGAVAGIDWRFSDETTLGVALGYARSRIDHETAGNDGDVESFLASLYGLHRPASHQGRLALDGALGVGIGDYRTRRRIAFGGLDRTAEGATDGYDLSARIGAGYRIDRQGYRIVPQAGLSYVRLHQDGYTETGAGAANLTVGDQDVHSATSRLGIEVARAVATESGAVWTPSATLAWRHEFAGTGRVIDAAFADPPATAFRVSGVEAGRDTIELAAGLAVTVPGGTTWRAGLAGSLAAGETAHGLFAGVRLAW